MTAAPIRASYHRAKSVEQAIGMVGLAAALVLLLECQKTLDTPQQAVVWGGLALACYSLGLLFLVGDDERSLGLSRWRLGSWTLLWFAVAFGLATVTWSQPQHGAPAQIAVSSVLRALWLVAVGLTAWMIGYRIGPPRVAESTARRATAVLSRRFMAEIRSPAAPWLLYCIGAAARLLQIMTSGHFGYVGDASSVVSSASSYQQLLTLLSYCAPLAVMAAALQVFRERLPSSRPTLAALFIAELAFAAAGGGKQSFVLAVLAIVIPYSATRAKLPNVMILAGIAILFLTVVIPFSLTYRAGARHGSTTLSTSEAFTSAPGILHTIINDYNPVTAIPSSLNYLDQRIREIDSPALIMQRTPSQIGFASSLQLISAPIAEMIPRAVWPGKPIIDTGYQISQEYYGLPPTVYNSSAVTPVGDLYRHGGWLPVVLGMLLFGCGVRLADKVLDIRQNPHAGLLLLLLFPTVIKNETDWPGLVVGIPATVLVWMLTVALVFKHRPQIAHE